MWHGRGSSQRPPNPQIWRSPYYSAIEAGWGQTEEEIERTNGGREREREGVGEVGRWGAENYRQFNFELSPSPAHLKCFWCPELSIWFKKSSSSSLSQKYLYICLWVDRRRSRKLLSILSWFGAFWNSSHHLWNIFPSVWRERERKEGSENYWQSNLELLQIFEIFLQVNGERK